MKALVAIAFVSVLMGTAHAQQQPAAHAAGACRTADLHVPACRGAGHVGSRADYPRL